MICVREHQVICNLCNCIFSQLPCNEKRVLMLTTQKLPLAHQSDNTCHTFSENKTIKIAKRNLKMCQNVHFNKKRLCFLGNVMKRFCPDGIFT